MRENAEWTTAEGTKSRQETLLAPCCIAHAKRSHRCCDSIGRGYFNSGDEEQQRLTAYSIFKLATGKGIVDKFLAANAIRLLIKLIKAGSDERQTWALNALANISGFADITDTLTQLHGAHTLAKLVQAGNDEQKELATYLLVKISMNGDGIALPPEAIQPAVAVILEKTNSMSVKAVVIR